MAARAVPLPPPAAAPQALFELAITIAGLPTRLTFTGLEAPARARLADWYAAFTVPVAPEMPHVAAQVEPGAPFIPPAPGPWQVRSTRSGSRIEFVSHLERGWFDLASGQGVLTLRPTGNPENFLRVLYAWRCLETGGLLLHAAGLVQRGRGYVFFGRSGSGKTTTTRLSPGAAILSDDLVILRCVEIAGRPAVQVYGVPFRGDLAEAPRRNAAAPLAGLYALVKDTDHFREPLAAHAAVGQLSACVPFVMSRPADAGRVLALCAEITARVPVWTLHFRRDPGFWKVIDAG